MQFNFDTGRMGMQVKVFTGSREDLDYYEEWRALLQVVLHKSKILVFATTPPAKPAPTHADYPDYMLKNADLYGALFHLTGGVARGVVTAAGNGGMDGLNALMVFKLKYEGNGTVRLIALLRRLQSCQLLEGEDVDTWFNRLETLIGHLTDLKEPVSDNRRLAHCLDALKGHEMLITVLDGLLAENKLTYDGLKTQARTYFNRRETTEEPKTALQTHARPCTLCRKLGHGRHACPERKGQQAAGGGARADDGPKKRKKCSHCKKLGHDGLECRSRLAGRPPAGTNPSARVAQVEYFEAYVMMAQGPLMGPSSAALAPKGAVSMMVDTGASHHLVPTTASMTNVRPGAGSVKVANGHDMVITQVGSMNVHIVDNHGDKQLFKLDPVLVVPELGCPLFGPGCPLGDDRRI